MKGPCIEGCPRVPLFAPLVKSTIPPRAPALEHSARAAVPPLPPPVMPTLDCRAVVPPAAFLSSRDVLSPSGQDCASSPHALGLGVYALPPEGSSSPPSALPLLYVSPQAAKDRVQEADWRNAAGVRKGWYVIAAPGTAFEVRVTQVNARAVGEPDEDAYRATVFVDGDPTNESFFFEVPERGHTDAPSWGLSDAESVFRGFTQRVVPDEDARGSGAFHRSYRPFRFQERAGEQGNVPIEAGTGAGTIRLDVAIGKLTERRDPALPSEYCTKTKRVSEKAKEKEGVSVGVERTGEVRAAKGRFSEMVTTQRRPLPEASVTVYVREKSWLRSRRIINDAGEACTHVMFQYLLKKDNEPVGAEQAEQAAWRSRKKVKKEMLAEGVIDLDEVKPFAPGEVIDLC